MSKQNKIQVWLRPDQCDSLLLLINKTADFAEEKIDRETNSNQVKCCTRIGIAHLRDIAIVISDALEARQQKDESDAPV